MSRPLFTLDDRLMTCANFVRENKPIADIGTDHAYLPVWLTKTGKTPRAIAADINPEPLKHGDITIEKYCATNLVETRLSNGLENIKDYEVCDIIIAGMGGELIAQIIGSASWLKNKDKHLILQPMSKPDFLRKYLYENGFDIVKEHTASSDGKIYSVLSVYYSGNNTINYNSTSIYIGKLNPKQFDLDKEYTKKQIISLEKKANGLLIAKQTYHANKLFDIINELKKLID